MGGKTGRLTGKQARFVEHYLITLHASEAARLAGYSEKTAQQMARENLLKPVIAAAIKEAQDGVSKRNQITVDEVVSELKRHSVGAKRDMITMRGLQLLGQHLSMFTKRVEHQADFSLLDALRRIEAREDAAKQRRPSSPGL